MKDKTLLWVTVFGIAAFFMFKKASAGTIGSSSSGAVGAPGVGTMVNNGDGTVTITNADGSTSTYPADVLT
jgi:hypothetical protein